MTAPGKQFLEDLARRREGYRGPATKLGLEAFQQGELIKSSKESCEAAEETHVQSAPAPNPGTLVLDGVAVRLRSAHAALQQIHSDIKTIYPSVAPVNADNKDGQAEPKSTDRVAADVVLNVAAEILDVKVEDLLERSRKHAVSRPRQTVTYFLIECMGYTMVEAAEPFKAHHTTAMHSRNKLAEILYWGPVTEVERSMLIGLRKLCRHFNKQLPVSNHWPPEEPKIEKQNPVVEATAR